MADDAPSPAPSASKGSRPPTANSTASAASGEGGSASGAGTRMSGGKANWAKVKGAVAVGNEMSSATMRRAQLRIAILEKEPSARSREEVLILEELMLRIKFLEQLARPTRLEICRVATYKQFETGHVLFKQGDAGDAFYIVLSGSAAVSVKDANTGIEMVVASCLTGQSFGELALQDPSSKRAATVTTREPTEFLVVYSEDYNRILKHLISDELTEKLFFLQRVPVFRDVPTNNLQALASVLTTRSFNKGKVIAKQGSESDELFIIKRGSCRLVKEVKLDKRGHKDICTLRREVMSSGANVLCDNLKLPPITGDPLFFEEPHRRHQAEATRRTDEAAKESSRSEAKFSFSTPRGADVPSRGMENIAEDGEHELDEVDGVGVEEGGEETVANADAAKTGGVEGMDDDDAAAKGAESQLGALPVLTPRELQATMDGSSVGASVVTSSRRRQSVLPSLPSAIKKEPSYVTDVKGDPFISHELSYAKMGRKPRCFLELGHLHVHDYFGEVGHGTRSFRSSSVIANGIVECFVLNKWDFQRRLTEETVAIINQNMKAYRDDEEIRKEFSKSIKWLRYKQRVLRDATLDFKGTKRREAFQLS